MKRWLRRLRGAIGMGVTWGVGWALVGVLIGVAMNLGLPMRWFVRVFDAPLPALWVPGFFAGAAFSVVLGIGGRGRRFDELSLRRFAAWGALGGLVLGLIPVAAAGTGMTTATITVALGTLTVLSAASATGTLMLARMAQGGTPSVAGETVAGEALVEGEARKLSAGGAALETHPTARMRERARPHSASRPGDP